MRQIEVEKVVKYNSLNIQLHTIKKYCIPISNHHFNTPVLHKNFRWEGRKWEELNLDCLVNVFGRVGMESLLLDVPLVCKPWYKATLDPKCWEHLIFPEDIKPCSAWDYICTPYPGRIISEYGHRHYIKGLTEVGCPFPITAFMKFVINRSRRCATELSLSFCCCGKALKYAANECPALKALSLNIAERCIRSSLRPSQEVTIIPKLLSNWKNLETLDFGRGNHSGKALAKISLHCNITKLAARGTNVGSEVASAIVTSLPKLKYLVLEGSTFYKQEYLVLILLGCKEIVHLDVRNCIGFDKNDVEILELASHIPAFMCEGSISF